VFGFGISSCAVAAVGAKARKIAALLNNFIVRERLIY
jgi:hypothetical protein